MFQKTKTSFEAIVLSLPNIGVIITSLNFMQKMSRDREKVLVSYVYSQAGPRYGVVTSGQILEKCNL